LILLQFLYRLGYLAIPLTTDYDHRLIVRLRLVRLSVVVSMATSAAATVLLLFFALTRSSS